MVPKQARERESWRRRECEGEVFAAGDHHTDVFCLPNQNQVVVLSCLWPENCIGSALIARIQPLPSPLLLYVCAGHNTSYTDSPKEMSRFDSDALGKQWWDILSIPFTSPRVGGREILDDDIEWLLAFDMDAVVPVSHHGKNLWLSSLQLTVPPYSTRSTNPPKQNKK